MPQTTYNQLRYPQANDSTNVWTYWQNLAEDVDQKVITRVTNDTARNALTKYDGMKVYVIATKRTFRWDSTNSRWEFEAGPRYTWTPLLQDLANNPVTASPLTSRGTYVIQESMLDFKADFRFQGGIDGRTGSLRLVLPAGVVAKSTEPEQHTVEAYLFTPTITRGWMGKGSPVIGTSQVALEFPVSQSDCSLSLFRNATGAGVTGSGIPLISGSYPLVDGSRMAISGQVELSSWTAL